MNNNENYIPILKHLVSICNDGKEGYLKASENTNSPTLTSKFTCYATEREEFAKELKAQITKYGGTYVDNDGGPLGALHRIWMGIKKSLSSEDDKTILETCKTGDKVALQAYDEALQGNLLENSELKALLINQRGEISETLEEIDRLYFHEKKK